MIQYKVNDIVNKPSARYKLMCDWIVGMPVKRTKR